MGSEDAPKTELQLLQEIAESLEKRPTPAGLIWLDGFLPIFITICSFGGSITFTVIPTVANGTPIPHRFDAAEVRTFLSLAWLFFVLALVFAMAGSLKVTYRRKSFEKIAEKPHTTAEFSQKLLVSLFGLYLQIFTGLAFIFLSLVVVAYTPVVGWIAFAFASIFLLYSIVIWIFCLVIK